MGSRGKFKGPKGAKGGPRGPMGSRGMSWGWFDESSEYSQGIYACIQVIQIFSWPTRGSTRGPRRPKNFINPKYMRLRSDLGCCH